MKSAKTLRRKTKSVKVPRRLAPYITPAEMQMVGEAQLADSIAEKQKTEPKRQNACSENFDVVAALATYLAPGDRNLGSTLVGLVGCCVPTDCALDVAASLMKKLRPKNFLEVLLLSQMTGAHLVGLYELGLARQNAHSESADFHVNRAVRLMRLFTTQLEVLQALRSKGRSKRQKIIVQHQHVNVMGQAVVGVRQGAGA